MFELTKRVILKNNTIKYHNKNQMLICKLLQGSLIISFSEKEIIELTSNDFMILSPETSYTLKTISPKSIFISCTVDPVTLIGILDSFQKKNPDYEKKNYCIVTSTDEISEDFLNLYFLSQNKKKESFLMDLYLKKLVYSLSKEPNTYSFLCGISNHRMVQIKHYINKNVTKIASINELAKHFHMSASNLSHQFKNKFDVRPLEYMNTQKMHLAANYLKHKTVSETAYDLGYENISYFIRLFKSQYSLTPKQYQQNNNS